LRALVLRFALLATLALASLPGCSRDMQPAPGVDGLPPQAVETLAPESLPAIEQAARQGGFPLLRADLADCTDKSGFLARVATALSFPCWFGHNWDALADCLRDLSWLPAAGYVVVLEHADRFRAGADDDFVTALELFEDTAREWAAAGVPMWVFVDLTAGDAGPRAP
jgi:hypothetical protein